MIDLFATLICLPLLAVKQGLGLIAPSHNSYVDIQPGILPDSQSVFQYQALLLPFVESITRSTAINE